MAMASVIGPIINNRDRLSPAAIGIDAEQHATDRPHEKADAERGGREQQRGILAFCWEKQARDDHGEESENDEIVPFERVTDHGGDDLNRLRSA
jgi:hypothetical protein